MQGPRAANDLLVSRVAADDVDPDRDRFLALVGDDDPLPDLGGVGVALGDRRAGTGLVLGLGGGTALAPLGGGLLAVGKPLRGTLVDRNDRRRRPVRQASLDSRAPIRTEP